MSDAKAIQRFPFHGDDLDVVRDEDGVFVGIRAVCESLGVSMQGQLEKLRSDPSTCIKMILTQMPGDGQAREIAFVDVRSLPLWLATIHPSKVKPAVREKLIAYKRDCAEALARHFFGERRPTTSDAGAAALIGRLVEIVASLEARLVAVESRPVNANQLALGAGGARVHVLDPLKEIARIEARAIGKSDRRALNRMRKLADDALRERVGFPRDGGQAWCMFPQARLGDLHCALARIAHDARRRSDIAAPATFQLSLVPNLQRSA